MPLYEFQCKKCRKEYELLLGVNEPMPERCESCNGKLVKKIHAPAIQFKGSGFYITDYAKKSSPPATSEPVKKSGDQKESKKDS